MSDFRTADTQERESPRLRFRPRIREAGASLSIAGSGPPPPAGRSDFTRSNERAGVGSVGAPAGRSVELRQPGRCRRLPRVPALAAPHQRASPRVLADERRRVQTDQHPELRGPRWRNHARAPARPVLTKDRCPEGAIVSGVPVRRSGSRRSAVPASGALATLESCGTGSLC